VIAKRQRTTTAGMPLTMSRRCGLRMHPV
jgi:hypothetical protein